MDNLGRDMERLMWALLLGGLLAGAAVMYVVQRIARWFGW